MVVFNTYDEAIELMMEQEKKICEWNHVDHYKATNDMLHDGNEDWSYDSSEQDFAWTHYSNTEDDYYIDIRPLRVGQLEDVMQGPEVHLTEEEKETGEFARPMTPMEEYIDRKANPN